MQPFDMFIHEKKMIILTNKCIIEHEMSDKLKVQSIHELPEEVVSLYFTALSPSYVGITDSGTDSL
jgi:hypothetical protein